MSTRSRRIVHEGAMFALLALIMLLAVLAAQAFADMVVRAGEIVLG